MTAPPAGSNGHLPPIDVQAVALIGLLPMDATSPTFSLVAQWHTNTGILCAAKQIIVQPMGHEHAVQLFISLVGQGVIGQIVKLEDGSEVVADLPDMMLCIRPAPTPPAEPAAEEKPVSRIILPGA